MEGASQNHAILLPVLRVTATSIVKPKSLLVWYFIDGEEQRVLKAQPKYIQVSSTHCHGMECNETFKKYIILKKIQNGKLEFLIF